jgi:hypothetical protein
VVIPDRNVTVDLAEGRARMEVSQLAVEDYHDIVNALQEGPSVPADVSFEVHWFHPAHRDHVHNGHQHFELDAIETRASIEWSATRGGFRFESDEESTSKTAFAEIGRERNGVFA